MRYALTDPKAKYPRPVTGWYDTTNHRYAAMPPEEALTPVSDEVWAARLEDPSGFVLTAKGKVVPR